MLTALLLVSVASAGEITQAIEDQMRAEQLDDGQLSEQQLDIVAFGGDLVPFVGSSSVGASHTVRRISVNLIGGYTYGIQGVEASAGFNLETGFVEGAQAAAGANINLGRLQGVQGAGGFNLAGSVDGLQGSGGANLATGDVRGAQLSGGANVATGDVRGLQAAPLNLATGDVKGVQLGVVNLARSSDVSLGLVNVIWNGRTHVDVWGDTWGFARAGFKHGSRYVHNIYTAGVKPGGEAWSIGLGLGGHVPVGDRAYLDLEILAHHINEGTLWCNQMDLLSQGRAVLGVQLFESLAIFAGPTYDVRVTDTRQLLRVEARPGAVAGIQLF